MRPQRGRRAAGALAAALLVAACGGSGDSDDASSDTRLRNTVPPSPNEQSGETGEAPPPAVDPGDQVLPDYRAYWRVFVEATRHPNPDDPTVVAHATGDALTTSQGVLTYMKDSRLVSVGDVEVAPRVVSVLRTSAEIADCYRSTLNMHDARTGVLREKADTRRQRLRVHLVRTSRTWKVALIERQEFDCTEA